MHRLIFWGIIILAAMLLFALVGIIIYWVLRLLLAKPEARTASLCLIGALTLLIAASCVWGHLHTRLQVDVKTVECYSNRLPKAFEGFRIAQLSDMHLGSFTPEEGRDLLSRLADSIAAQQPDIIVFTGDLVTLRSAEAIPFREGLKRLAQIPSSKGEGYIPVYSILGNHDYADYVRSFTPERRQQDVDSLIAMQEEAGWHMLRNEGICIERGDSTHTERIALVGVENIGEPPFSVYGDLNKAIRTLGDSLSPANTFTVLLSHNPTHWRSEALASRIDLMLAGHTHAMQMVIGGWSPSQWKYPEWMGLYSEGQQHLYVNTGTGCVGPAIRIGVAPEVTVITIRNEE